MVDICPGVISILNHQSPHGDIFDIRHKGIGAEVNARSFLHRFIGSSNKKVQLVYAPKAKSYIFWLIKLSHQGILGH